MPLIVFDDADLDVAVAAAIVCKFRNRGRRVSPRTGSSFRPGSTTRSSRASRRRSRRSRSPTDSSRARRSAADHLAALANSMSTWPMRSTARPRSRQAASGSRPVLPPVDLHGRHRRNADGPRGDVRPDRRDRRFESEEAVAIANATPWPRGVLHDHRPRPDVARRRGARVRDPRREHGDHLDRGGAVRRHEGVGIGREGSSLGVDDWLELKYWALGGLT